MNTDLLAGVFFEHWVLWQDIVFIAMLAAAAVLFFSILVFIVLNNARMESDGRRAAKRVAWYEQRIALERKALEAEEEKARLELEQSRKELSEKREAADEAETAAVAARQKIFFIEQELKKLFEQNEMNKRELAEYQKREGTYVPEDVVINILTERVINESRYDMDAAFTDCKIPRRMAAAYNMDTVKEYIAKKPDVEVFEGKGKTPARYKVNGKVFAFVYGTEKGISISYKCGTDYGAKLTNHLKGIVANAKFPYGLIWYSVSNETLACPLELMQLLIDISYRIAKLGY